MRQRHACGEIVGLAWNCPCMWAAYLLGHEPLHKTVREYTFRRPRPYQGFVRGAHTTSVELYCAFGCYVSFHPAFLTGWITVLILLSIIPATPSTSFSYNKYSTFTAFSPSFQCGFRIQNSLWLSTPIACDSLQSSRRAEHVIPHSIVHSYSATFYSVINASPWEE